MNAEQAQALFQAEKDGVPQLIGELRDLRGGYCAMGVLIDLVDQSKNDAWVLAETPVEGCSLCGAVEHPGGFRIHSEWELIVHLNNDHKMTFSEIARKLGPDSV